MTMKMKYSIKSTYHNVYLFNFWYMLVINHQYCSSLNFLMLILCLLRIVFPTTHVLGLFTRPRFSHMIFGPKYIERIGMNILNGVIYN